MSVTDQPEYPSDLDVWGPGGPSASPSGGGYAGDRMPPQDNDAERRQLAQGRPSVGFLFHQRTSGQRNRIHVSNGFVNS